MVESLKAVKTIIGKTYVLSFAVGDANNACKGSMVVEAFAGRDTLKVPYESRGTGGFKRASIRFVAVSTRTRVMFYNTFYAMRSDDFSSLWGLVIYDVKLLSVRLYSKALVIPVQTVYISSGWDLYAWAFQAESEVAQIVIHNRGEEEDPACGPLIDGVAIRAIYPPPTNKQYIITLFFTVLEYGSGWDLYAWAFQAESEVAEIVIHNPGVAIRAIYPPRPTNNT
ncbi:hypothetical protein DY000_02026041 [Brassica cretica]|uniref:DUF642 domain-containing protein n=1 Tax=Brassica cretica TaxID=69181 RepID=A0ABQ7EID4_BRACR|nr:hypothetical protein DY000_02026041 [Brassica cretica]